jgi:hypothetical protein
MTDFKTKLKLFGKLMVSDVNHFAEQEKIVLDYLLCKRCITIEFIKERTKLSEKTIINAFENLDKKELIEYDRYLRCLRIINFKKYNYSKPVENLVQ